jgi:hypothetical protein
MSNDADRIDALALTHGQARWVLWHLDLRVGDDEDRLDAWLKYVRRMGVPFWPDELGRGTGVNVVYRYSHLMELTVAMALRTQGILPGDMLGLLARYRELLRRLYRQAWLERESGLGAPIKVLQEKTGGVEFGAGTFLRMRLSYSHGGMLVHTEPELIGPWESVRTVLTRSENVYLRPPLPLSDLAADVVRLAEGAPEIRRGRP